MSENVAAISEAARDFIKEAAPFDVVRQIVDSPEGWAPDTWRTFAQDLGFAGLAAPESAGGAGLGVTELCTVAEALGETLLPIPWFESAVLSTLILRETGGERFLDAIASGKTIATFAARDAAGGPLPQALGARIVNGKLSGETHFVPFGAHADLFVVAAREDKGVSLVVAAANAGGISLKAETSFDPTRPLATIAFHDVTVADARVGAAGAGATPLMRALDLASVVLAAEQVGGMARTLDGVVAYSKQRVQFGRVIGSFQAMKHRFADMKLLLEGARSALAWALRAIETNDPQAPLACAGARAYCSQAYLKIAAEGIQLHGGIGFTWEHHAHLFFKRARSSSTLLDPPSLHKERVASALLDKTG
jgi:alkylation response protein AidB-like acyl-CoA dehydrogenase